MTFQVFVGYGDNSAKRVGDKLGHYLQRFGMKTFVASTDPQWMLPSYSIGYIYRQLSNSDILIAVCTGNTLPTSKLGQEIRYAGSNKIPIFPFLERGANVPFQLRNTIWCVDFDLNSPWRQHRKVALDVLWLMEKSMETRAQIIRGVGVK